MSSAFSAAKAIQDRHDETTVICRAPDEVHELCEWCRENYPCPDYEAAGVVLARLNEAIQRLESILTDGDLPDYDAIEQHAVAALALLRDDTKDTP